MKIIVETEIFISDVPPIPISEQCQIEYIDLSNLPKDNTVILAFERVLDRERTGD
jgi:hypothetical protein